MVLQELLHSNKKEIQILLGCRKDSDPVLKNGVNMDFDKTIGGYLENTEWKGRTDIGRLLNGCRQMYAATQDERYQKFILQYVEKNVRGMGERLFKDRCDKENKRRICMDFCI